MKWSTSWSDCREGKLCAFESECVYFWVQISKAVINQYTGNSNKPPSSRHWLTCCSPVAVTLCCCAQSDHSYFISECTQHAISWWQADQAKKWLFISIALQCFQICSRVTTSRQTLIRLMCLFHFLYIYSYNCRKCDYLKLYLCKCGMWEPLWLGRTFKIQIVLCPSLTRVIWLRNW